MKYVVLKELPDGSQPGDIVDYHEDIGSVFLSIDAVRVATEDDKPKRRGGYRRRDLKAESSTD